MALVKAPYPILGEDGWTTEPLKVADTAFSDFCLADVGQTYFFSGSLKTLSQILQETNTAGIEITMSLIQLAIAELFRLFFNEVSVVCEDTTDTTNNPMYGEITIYITFYDLEGNHYDLSKLIEHNKSSVYRISEVASGR